MDGNPDRRHSRKEVLNALMDGRKKASSFLAVNSEKDVRSPEDYRVLFGFLQTSAQKETDLERYPEMDDIRMDELIPVHVSPKAVIQLREVASVATMQELLSADPRLVQMALASENRHLREFVLAMVPEVALSYAQYLNSLEVTQQFLPAAHH